MSSSGPGYKSLPLELNPERIRSIPDEILAFIFELCLPTEYDYTPAECFPLTKHTPLNVIHVCSRWRKIAISNSKLWTVLYLGTRDSREQRLELLKDILAVWEERSRYRPMTISISLMPHPEYDSSGTRQSIDTRLQLHRQAWSLLLPHFSQLLAHCKRLEIGRASEDVLRVIKASDSIQELLFLGNGDDVVGRRLPDLTFNGDMLRMHDVQCKVYSFSQSLSISNEELLVKANLPSTRLRRVYLTGLINTQSFVMLATALPTLEELHIKVFSFDRSHVAGPSQHQSPSSRSPPSPSPLIRLSVDIDCGPPAIISDLQDALMHLSFPYLRRLNLGFPSLQLSSQIEPVIRSIASALHSSQSPVESLRLHWRIRPSEDTIAALLRAVPQLMQLSLYDIDGLGALTFVQVLTATTEEIGSLCPELESIDFQFIGWRHWHARECGKKLITLISTRCTTQPTGKLSRLTFLHSSTDDDAREICAIVTGSEEFNLCRERGFVLQTFSPRYSGQ